MFNFTNLLKNDIPTFNSTTISRWLEDVVISEDFVVGDVQYIFCNDNYLHKINIDFLNHDTLTDIITFSTSNNVKIISGEIFISIERIIDNCEIHHKQFYEEFRRVLVHGILHLIGYDDHSENDKLEMRNKENYYLILQNN